MIQRFNDSCYADNSSFLYATSHASVPTSNGNAYTYGQPREQRSNAYAHDTSLRPSQASSTVPSRFSLSSRSIYNQQDREPRSMANADNHLKLVQNLRQGVPINQHRIDKTQMDSPITQLATNMLLQRPMPMPATASEPLHFLQNRHHDRLLQLQPAKQQLTPPFNLSKFSHLNWYRKEWITVPHYLIRYKHNPLSAIKF
jgi:hypothetical protein